MLRRRGDVKQHALGGQLLLDPIRDIAGFRARGVTMTGEVESGFVPSRYRSVLMTGSQWIRDRRLPGRGQSFGLRSALFSARCSRSGVITRMVGRGFALAARRKFWGGANRAVEVNRKR